MDPRILLANRARSQWRSITTHPYFGFILIGVLLLGVQLIQSLGVNIPTSIMRAFGLTMVYIVIGLGFAILLGYAGLASLGTAGFVGIGTYALGYFTKQSGYSVGAIVVISILGAVVIGAIVGFISLRIEGMYLAIITLGTFRNFKRNLQKRHDHHQRNERFGDATAHPVWPRNDDSQRNRLRGARRHLGRHDLVDLQHHQKSDRTSDARDEKQRVRRASHGRFRPSLPVARFHDRDRLRAHRRDSLYGIHQIYDSNDMEPRFQSQLARGGYRWRHALDLGHHHGIVHDFRA
ncbi:MAG: branched-chain amino acid ABC transporter permease [Bacillus subtilis]|nr:branched-chain amino acid ABC transporter permease [Bacillus subtilis]